MGTIPATTSKSLTEELAAIRTSAAIYPLTSRAFLRITGPDATRWLNGMVTNNIAALAPGEGNYNFLLNSQGRIQGDCTIYREPGAPPATYLLETDASQIETIHSHLDKFIIMDDVELTHGLNVEGNKTENSPQGLALAGPGAAELVGKFFIDHYEIAHLKPLPSGTMTPAREGEFHSNVVILTPVDASIPTYEIWCWNRSIIKDLYRKFESSEANTISPQALEAFRILSAVPKFGVDITEKILPQETAQTHALHFSKGCYLGQEIVERIHSRGQVHRTFTQFTLTGEMPTLPAALESSGKPAGELTSAALIDGTLYALGYARRELLETHQPLTYSGGVATPSEPPKLTT